jgi:phosphoglycolate phosphatase-like HAD superfamily hydrolase
MIAAKQAHKSLPIVSNNSEQAIAAYVEAEELGEYLSVIVGRVPYQPELMKPNPYTVLAALEILQVQPTDSVLVGDSVVDIEAAHKAGVHVAALANKAHKLERFRNSGADVVVTSMSEIRNAIQMSNYNI